MSLKRIYANAIEELVSSSANEQAMTVQSSCQTSSNRLTHKNMPSAWRKLLAAVPHHQSTQQLKNDFRSQNQSSQRRRARLPFVRR
eukprot:scaffold2451_cov103-Skeletonema_marinoi.AAC.5